jgi:hypothetical protein
LSAKAIYQILLNVTDSSDGDIAVNSTTLARYTQEPAEAIESCLDELEAAGYLDGIGGA